ncbi:MAG: sugar phosphate isomerase/epimerase [Acidobacteria bacterium]|nr:sugar phosphate isomerase/epimerase [Acidobacteriota bacterium]
MNRRHFLELGAGVAAGLAAQGRNGGWKVGMCCWNMRDFEPSVFDTAAKIGLDGVQLGISNTDQETLKLRRPEVQREYIAAAKRAGVAIVGTACQFRRPLKSEPVAALVLHDWIEVTRSLGAKVILVPFFGKGNLVDVNVKEEFDRLVAVLRELGPRAEKAGVILGLENTLSAVDNRKILDAVGSPAVQVYYDVGNSTNNGHPVLEEIPALGKERICEFHIKDGRNLLGQGKIDMPAIAQAIRSIGYEKWLVLETSSPTDLVADTRTNLEYMRRVFTRS